MLDMISTTALAGAENTSSKKSDFAYERIRKAIVEFQLFPGQFIDKVDLCKSLKVSRQPVTTALSRLEREGLVEILPQRGSYVSRLSLSALMQALFIQSALEHFAVRALARAPGEAVLVTLQANTSAYAAAIDGQNLSKAADLDAEFHRTITNSLMLPKVMEQVEIGLAAISRCQHVVKTGSVHGPASVREHAEIVQALIDRDEIRAGDVLIAHLNRFGQLVEAEAKIRPDIFIP